MDIYEQLRIVNEESLAVNSLLGKRIADWSVEELQKYESVDRLRKARDLVEARQQTLLDIQKLALQQSVDVSENVKDFEPDSFEVDFPFLQLNEDKYLTLVDRDEILREINDVALEPRAPKYTPIVISTSRGMGKTFLLKMIGLQKVPPSLVCQPIQDAGKCGRIISMDFSRIAEDSMLKAEDIARFFPQLMVFYLSHIFRGCRVDGIYFEEIIKFSKVTDFKGSQPRYNAWKSDCLDLDTDGMIKEYMRLTDIAFGVKCSTPPVFLLDEIQKLCTETNIQSTYDGSVHTLLSLLLTQLAGKYWPICICTGTNNGRIMNITDMSRINPKVLSLTPLKSGYLQNWKEMTSHRNLLIGQSTEELEDTPLFRSLVYATYKIPRLLCIAHGVWFKSRLGANADVHCLFRYEKKAITYYKEMKTIWNDFAPEDIAHIIFATGCRWPVPDPDQNIPGTRIPWSFLVNKSLIFPYQTGYYLFPFGLIWSQTDDAVAESTVDCKSKVQEVCCSLVKNLDIKHLFMRYSDICVSDPHECGMLFEKLLTASFAVKYYLWKLQHGDVNVKFTSLYPLSSYHASSLLDNRTIDFSQGIDFPETEATVEKVSDHSVTRNREVTTAHHDMILSSKEGPIPVQVKASFRTPSAKDIISQLAVTRGADKQVDILIWISLTDSQTGVIKNKFKEQVVFLDGSGVCNGMSMDMFQEAKKLEKADRQSP